MDRVQVLDILYAMPEIGIRPPDFFLSSVTQHLTKEAPTFANGKQLVEMLLTTAKYGLHPDHVWLCLVAEEMCWKMRELELDDLANVWWSFGVLGYEPADAWQAAFASGVKEALPRASPMAASKMIISSALSRRSGRGFQGVPGGEPVLEMLVQKILYVFPSPSYSSPTPGSNSMVSSPPSTVRSESLHESVDVRLLKDMEAPWNDIYGVNREGLQQGGLRNLGSCQLLLTLDALVNLEYKTASNLIVMFAAHARKQTSMMWM
jgi:hypothetical protein